MANVAQKGGLALFILLVSVVLAGCGPQMADAGWGMVNADGTAAYTGINTGKLLALNTDSGLQRWEFPKGKENLAGFYGTPALAGNLVIFGATDPMGRTARAYAIDVASGEQRWACTEPEDMIAGSPVVAGDTVYVTSADRNVYALSVETGQVLWRFAADGAVWSGVVAEGDRLYFGSMGKAVYAVDADGHQVWRFPTEGAVPGTPATAEGLVYAGDLSSTLYAIDAQSGREVWRFKAAGWLWGQPAVVDGKLYVPSLDGRVYQLDAKTGARGWTFEAKGAIRAGPAYAGDTLYVASEDQNLYAVDINTGNPRWTFAAAGPLVSSPVVAGGTVYVATSNGKSYALDAASGAQRWVYPQPK